jgi:hypothetical protein
MHDIRISSTLDTVSSTFGFNVLGHPQFVYTQMHRFFSLFAQHCSHLRPGGKLHNTSFANRELAANIPRKVKYVEKALCPTNVSF